MAPTSCQETVKVLGEGRSLTFTHTVSTIATTDLELSQLPTVPESVLGMYVFRPPPPHPLW